MPDLDQRARLGAIDWAKDAHAVSIVDERGCELLAESFPHTEAGLCALTRVLTEAGAERVAVVAVHPNKLASARERHSASGKKSDGFDAYVLADLLRTDGHRFASLRPDGDETRALRALSRTREDLVGARVALANQLRAQLEAFWPGAAVIFSEVDSPIALAFLARYPSPEDARRLGPRRLEGFLGRERYCGACARTPTGPSSARCFARGRR